MGRNHLKSMINKTREKKECFLKQKKYWLWAAVLFAGTIALLWFHENGAKEEYRGGCLGDSIIGNERDETSITAVMEKILGTRVYNGAFGGTTMSCRYSDNRASVTEDTLSMAQLARAIAYQDFGVQNAGVTAWSPMEYFPESMCGFQKIDFNKVEVLVIEHGVNDYLAGAELDNPEDPYDQYTFGGALRSSLKILKERYPDLRIILATPIYCWYVREGVSCEERDFGNGLLEDYVNLELEIGREFGVEILDNYHESGIGSTGTYEEWEQYTVDGVHLNEEGRALIGGRLAEAVRKSDDWTE